MAAGGSFTLTPHKTSVCILMQLQTTPPFPFSSVSQHNRLGLYLLALTKSYDDIVEPTLEDLLNQLREIGGSLGQWLIHGLTTKLSSLLSPDDLFNFFTEMRGILGGSDSVHMEENQVILDPSSFLGMFLRRCILAFNLLSFEGICHLWTNIGNYKEALSSCLPYGFQNFDGSSNDLESFSEYENMDLENYVPERTSEEIEESKQASERVPFHFHAPQAICALVEDVEVVADLRSKNSDRGTEGCLHVHPLANAVADADPNGEAFLRTNWQVQGYLMEQADAIEKHGSSFSFSTFEMILKQIKKLAPELHRVHYLHYLNSLYHDDYFAAVENLHCYFDYSAGIEGFDFASSSGSNKSERYEIALLCLGMMHFYFGHPKQALLVLTEAVRVCQEQSDDSCLAYTLAAICNLLSEIGSSTTAGILGTSNSTMTSMGISVSVAQQLFVLLQESLKRADSLNLKRLVASNHLAMAKFDLTHVQRPLLSFGPKVSMKLKTSPINVCKELRLCSNLISEFSSETFTATTDGALCTSWLKNLTKPMGSLVLTQDYGSGENFHALQFCMQPSSIPLSVLQILGSSYLLRATAWETYGSAPLARINALVHATCFIDSSSSSDAALVHAKLIQHLAVFQGYKEALSALKVAEQKFSSVSRSVILLLKLQLLHERALHRGHLKLAQQLCNELGVLASPVNGVDMELKREAGLRHARTLLAAKQFSEAAAIAHSLFCICYKFNMQVENAAVLLLLAEIHKKSGNAVLGLPYALASLSFCQSFNMDLLKASALLTIAELWLSLGSNHAKRALTLVHGALPVVLGHGGLELRARARIAEAKCYLSDPNYTVSEDPEVVLDPLVQASEECQVLEYHELAAEAFYLMALTYDKLGKSEEREEAAASFKKHITALENPQDEDDPLLNLFR
ncbi:anaphase-promoting complex subunit 5 [Mercurialis annua]|uniref:anaphase-promoting complex subunit 5 n=1 Tax=Mercurialis annua TaxID=3986 RepID=UPI002160A657|nr:anaphase-promoting complex subunit 5 [Mercurialis annua]